MKLFEIAPRRGVNADTGKIEGEHALIFGLTGFGKSYLIARLARLRTHTTVHDAKGSFAAPGMKRFTSLSKLVNAKPEKVPRSIYAPSRTELRDQGAQEAYFEWVYSRGNTTCIVDELTAVATTRTDIPDALFDCYARGREFGIEVWGCTQEPVWIPSITITQARNRYAFYVASLVHQKKVAGVMPGLSVDEILGLEKQQFHFYREGEKFVDDRGPFKLGSNVT